MRAILFSGIFALFLLGSLQAGPNIQVTVNPRPAFCPPRAPIYCPPAYRPWFPQAYWGPVGVYYTTGGTSRLPAFATGVYKVPPPPPLITTPVTVPAGRPFTWR